MKRILLITALLGIFFASCSVTKCPDCEEINCIYEQINNAVKGEGTDKEIETAIYEVCKERGITDPKTIDLLKAKEGRAAKRTHAIEYKRQDQRFYSRTFAGEDNGTFEECMNDLLKSGYSEFRIWLYPEYKQIHNIK
jgi:hypothetical protein